MIQRNAKFFLAGTIQGSEREMTITDQSYRDIIAATVQGLFPNATIFCPYKEMVARFGPRQERIKSTLSAVADLPVLLPQELDPQIREVQNAFHEFVERAASADVVISYLPNHIPSMGTAIEMWAARQRGRCVLCITKMCCNLAVLSTATAIVPTINAAGDWLQQHRI